MSERRTVALLVFCQSLFFSGVVVIMTLSALVGDMLVENKALTTLPLALQFTATMLSTVPASLLMRRYGRRAGFMGGLLIGAGGAVLAALSIVLGSFALFALGSILMGSAVAVAHFFRFAAADVASPGFRPRAISYVMLGGVVAALLGPELAKATRDLFPPFAFAGCFAAIALLWLVSLVPVSRLHLPRLSAAEQAGPRRPISIIARQPAFVVAALSGMVGYAVMTLVMTATPLAMVGHHHPFDDAATVIQWHVFAMFAPSFFTGHLITRFGVHGVIAAGGALILACVGINLSGTAFANYTAALVLLGVGWNFMFIGATTLLTTTHDADERARVQGLNEFVIFGAVALASLASGAVQHQLGWIFVNMIVAPLVLAAVVAVLWLRRRQALDIKRSSA